MRRERGLGLPEVLVAMAVGLLVLLVAAALLVSANTGYVAQMDQSELDDAGRYAFDTIERAVRQVAYVNWDQGDGAVGVDAASPASIAGLDAHSLNKAVDGIDAPRPDVANGSDVLALRFAGAGASANGDGSMLSCAGFGVGSGQDGWSIFYVARTGDGTAALFCKYRGAAGWSADALVGGVDSFQVLYGVDVDAGRRYLNASAVEQLDDALVLDGADAAARARDRLRKTHWKRISSIQVALLLHGGQRSRTHGEPQRFYLFGKDYAEGAGARDAGVAIDEARLDEALRTRERKLFSTTVVLRNVARGVAP